jgi:hypothetical protein
MPDATPLATTPPTPPPPSRAADFLDGARFHLARALRPRWAEGVATPAERALLSTPRPNARTVTGAGAQDYIAWRRSLCLVALATAAVTAVASLVLLVVELAGLDDQGGLINVGLLGFLEVVRMLGTVAFPAWMLWLAVKGWHDLRWSHRRLLWGWGTALAVSFGLALFPVGWVLQAAPGADPAAVDAVTQGLGLYVGLQYLILLLPAVLSLLVGVIRSSLAVKAFLPESALPGWTAAAAAPVLALLILVLAAVFTQFTTNVLVALGALALIAKYLLPVRHASRLARPHARTEVEAALRPLRVEGWVLGAIGGVLLLVALFTVRLLGRHLVGFGDAAFVNPFRAVLMVLDFAAKAILAAVVFSDALLAVLRHAWSEANALRASEVSAAFEARVEELDEAGIGTLRQSRPSVPAA